MFDVYRKEEVPYWTLRRLFWTLLTHALAMAIGALIAVVILTYALMVIFGADIIFPGPLSGVLA